MKNDVYEGDKATPGGNCPLKLGQNKGQIRAQPVEQDGQRKQKKKQQQRDWTGISNVYDFYLCKIWGQINPSAPVNQHV